MFMAQIQQFYELQHKAGLLKGKKTTKSSKILGARVTMLEEKIKNSGNESLFERLTADSKNNPAIGRKGSGNRQSSAGS